MKNGNARYDLEYVSLDKVDISDANVRKSIDDVLETQKDDFEALVKSIRELNVLQPIIVVRKGDRYDVIVGQCRTLAARKAGLKEIPAIIYGEMKPSEMKIISAVENLQRIDLTPVDKAAAVKDLVDEMGVREVSKRLGYSEGWVKYQLGLEGMLMVDGVKDAVEKGDLAAHEVARLQPLLKHRKPQDMADLVREVAKLKSTGQRDKAIRIARQNPEIAPEELKTEVKKRLNLFRISIELSDAEHKALQRAAEDAGSDPSDIAHSVISEWLKTKRYIS